MNKRMKAFGEWVSPSEELPQNGKDVIVKIDYSPDANFNQIAVMYYEDNDWHFTGANPNPYHGKYIIAWLKDLTQPEGFINGDSSKLDGQRHVERKHR